ncbi:MAG: transcription antitermination factor NusB [Deltaproteobacteria bacterium RIFOXYA12_FULL_58_15]|nr:MAG: transcription antitermination factor NusB [Deltaproteobacteria bacterium RIFOXYA12_FULL_58_15]OGR08518.1 MAG: transcription antitermination factor NusB [Deltaproteobacteria bacterium RIFOXYB12_FULL_58_9]
MRRRARECALQILYQLDMTAAQDGALPAEKLDVALERYWDSFEAVDADEREFAERLARGVVREVESIDNAIGEASRNWRLSRMESVDRNLLRLAAFEIIHCPDIPRAASINEAIEIAKRYGGGDSAAFINGILDKLGLEEP